MSRKKHIYRPAPKQQPIVYNQLVVKSPTRKPYDVGDWRAALRAADSGRVRQLYDLYDDILIDGLLADAVDKRIGAVLNAELTFQDSKGMESDAVSDLIDTPAFETLLRQIMLERFYGRSGAEIICSPDGFRVEPIPAKHISLATRSILIRDIDEHGIPYDGDSSILVLGREHDYGLLLRATPYAIYKRGGFGDWSQWIELFGMPQRIGKYNTYDPESRKLLEQAMEEAGSAPYIVIPKEAEVETITTTYSGSKSSYDEFRQACNEEILITILGQTLTTVQGEKGARALGEVHKEVEENKNKADMRFVQRVLNRQVLPMLAARGFPVAGGSFIFPKAAEQLSVADVVQLSAIMPIPQSYLHDKYSIPVPDGDEPVAGSYGSSHSSGQPDQPDSPDSPAQHPGRAALADTRRGFLRHLMDFFVPAPTKGAASTSISPTTQNDPYVPDLPDNRALSDESSSGGNGWGVIRRVADGSSSYFDATLFRHISEDLLNAVHTAFKQDVRQADGVVYDDLDDAFVTAMEQNLFHFSAAKTLAQVQQLNQEFRSAGTFEEYYRRGLAICGKYNKTWARTEHGTAVLTAESAANYQRLIKKTNLFPFWQYVSARDEKVRYEHRLLDGTTLRYDDPVWDKLWPPLGWNCRCRIRALLKAEVTPQMVKESKERANAYFASSEWKKIEQTHFANNPGKRAMVFDNNQMYIRNFTQDAAKLMAKVRPSDWGLSDDYRQLVRDATAEIKEYTGTAKDWWEAHRQTIDGKEVIVALDYNKRKWLMEWKEFNDHTSDDAKSRSFRTQYLDCIEEVMHDPDEVWLGQDFKDNQVKDYQLTQWLLIKYYKDVALVCVCKIQKGNLKFKSWYELGDARVRKGLLIYQK